MVFLFRMYYGVYISQSKFLIVGTSKLCIFFISSTFCYSWQSRNPSFVVQYRDFERVGNYSDRN